MLLILNISYLRKGSKDHCFCTFSHLNISLLQEIFRNTMHTSKRKVNLVNFKNDERCLQIEMQFAAVDGVLRVEVVEGSAPIEIE